MKKILTLLLSLIMALFVFTATGCNSKEETLDPNYDMLFDFETREELSSIKAFWDFGKMQLSEKNVTSGKSSMRLEVQGTYPDYQFAYGDWHMIDDQFLVFYMDKDNPHLKTQALNINNYSALEFDVTNSSDRDLPVRIFLSSYAKTTDKEGEPEREVNIDLGAKTVKKGKSETLSYTINQYTKMNMTSAISYIKLVVPNYEKGQTPAVLYVDNMRVKKADVKAYSKKFEENEIMLFENPQDVLMLTSAFDACQYKSGFTYSLNSDMTFSTQGNNSLKITRAKSPYAYQWKGNITAHISPKYLEKVDFTKFDKSKTVIKVDVMSMAEENEFVRFSVRANEALMQAGANLVKGKWETISIPMSWNAKGDFSNVYEMSFQMSEFFDGEARDLYVDNIRFEAK